MPYQVRKSEYLYSDTPVPEVLLRMVYYEGNVEEWNNLRRFRKEIILARDACIINGLPVSGHAWLSMYWDGYI